MFNAKKQNSKIFWITDYNMLIPHPANRGRNERVIHLRRLEMEAFGGWDPCRPMIVRRKGNKWQIKEGHNRLRIAKEKKWSIPCVETDCDLMPAQYHQHPVTWLLSDAVNCHADDPNCPNRLQYQILRNYHENYKLSYSISATLLQGGYSRQTDGTVSSIRDGTFAVTNKSYADAVGGIVHRLRPKFKKIGTEKCIVALGQCMAVDVFDPDRFCKQCETYSFKLAICGTSEQYVLLFEEIYNWRHPKGAIDLYALALYVVSQRRNASKPKEI